MRKSAQSSAGESLLEITVCETRHGLRLMHQQVTSDDVDAEAEV